MTTLIVETAALVAAGAGVDICDLTYAERTVALYASDMPTTPREWRQVHVWIVQGAERLGTDELRRRGAFLWGHRLLDRARVLTPQVQARHEQRFPLARRLRNAEKAASGSISRLGMSDAAVRRNGAGQVDGDCPCRETGTIECPDTDPDLSYDLVCPVHRPRRTGPFGGAA
ncbi:hypothetical protein ACFO3J_34635 [Streptomyces polygonati]|uniref:Uncharacterized protein n=1 Tax=Streptomyces polygonati TaxID=1617087 RepID=A0ABV8I219_9ACTN